MTKLQDEARTHNWNKAMINNSLGQVKRTLSHDKRLTDNCRKHLIVCEKELNEAMDNWDIKKG